MKQNAYKIFLTKLTVIFILASGLISLSLFEVSAQKSKKVQSSRKTYNRFNHKTAAHRKQTCNECHKVPTGFSNAESAAGEKYKYPDITDYPDHDSCVSCHRQQFFKGARPAICSICHTKVSPRDKVRFAFPVPNQQQEFTIRFPHNIHQDIIAKLNESNLRQDNIVSAHFVNTRFNIGDDKKTDYNNCTICHTGKKGKIYDTVPRRPQLVALETGLVTASHKEKIKVSDGYFKNVPTGHNSCFNCHYSEQKPTRNECGVCHILRKNPLAESNVIERLSLKFNHDQKKEDGTPAHDKECSSCHIRITQSASLKGLNPDVPIFTCASKGTGCHADEIKMEVDKRVEDLVERQKNIAYKIQSCSFCHTTFVGSYQIPESHKIIKP